MPYATEKMAVEAPIPRASVAIDEALNPGRRASPLRASRNSCRIPLHMTASRRSMEPEGWDADPCLLYLPGASGEGTIWMIVRKRSVGLPGLGLRYPSGE